MEEPTQTRPDRHRRALFVFGTWLLSYAIAAYLSLSGVQGKVAELVIDGCTSYMIIIAVTYLTSHSVDRANLFGRVMDMVEDRKNKG